MKMWHSTGPGSMWAHWTGLVALASVFAGVLPVVASSQPALAEVSLPAEAVAVAATSDGSNHWILYADGRVVGSARDRSFGEATSYISPGDAAADLAATKSGSGYWIASAEGGVFTFGDAQFYGSLGGIDLAAPIVAIVPTPTGRGYWLAAADGGVFAFGDAEFLGSLASLALAAPIVDVAATSSGDGYWLAASDGGVFAFGQAPYLGSAAESQHSGWVDEIVAFGASEGGYRMVSASGIDFRFGPLGDPNPRYFIRANDVIDIAAVDGSEFLALNMPATVGRYGANQSSDAAELQAARDNWASTGIDNYAVFVSGSSGFWCSFASLTTVAGGEPVAFERTAMSPYTGCWTEPVSVEMIHDMIESYIATGGAEVAVSYGDHGVPDSLTFDVPESIDEEVTLAFRFVQTGAVPAPKSPAPAPLDVYRSWVAIDSNGADDGWLAISESGHMLGANVALWGDAYRFVEGYDRTVADLAFDPTSDGYWIATSDGALFSYGPAQFQGSLGNLELVADIVSLKATSTGSGYWMAASDGGVFAFGDAGYFGSLGGVDLAGPIVDMAITPTGRGYWLVAADGGVFAFGDAQFLGSASGSLDSGDAVVAVVHEIDGYSLFTTVGAQHYFSATTGPRQSRMTNSSVADVARQGSGLLVLATDGEVWPLAGATIDWSATYEHYRDLWNQNSLNDYVMAFTGATGFECEQVSVLVAVSGGVVVDSAPESSACGFIPTIDTVFDLIATQLAITTDAIIAIDFDESGYPRHFEYSVPSVQGIPPIEFDVVLLRAR